MVGLPTFQVLLDDGTGTFPHNVTSFVRLSDGWSITRGRADQLSEIQPSTLECSFDNTTGVFTLGTATYDIAVNQRIRWIETVNAVAYTRFTGWVQSWPVAWPSGGQEFAVAQITATDVLARLARTKVSGLLRQEILTDAPVFYYPLSEATGALVAEPLVDTVTVGQMVKYPTRTQGLMVFGQNYPPVGDAGPVPVFQTGPSGVSGGEGLICANTTPTSSVTTFEFIYRRITGGTDNFTLLGTTSAPSTDIHVVGGTGTLSIERILSGNRYDGLFNGLTLDDGLYHHICISSLTVYVDGVSQGALTLNGAQAFTQGRFVIGEGPDAVASGTITISHFAGYSTALSAARVLKHAQSMNGAVTDGAADRVSRYLAFAGVTIDAGSETGVLTNVPHVDTTGANVGDLLDQVVTAEGGVLFAKGDGNVILHNRHHRALKLTGAFTLTAADIGPDTTVVADMQGVTNSATYTPVNGAPQMYESTSLIATHGQYPDNQTILVSTNGEALEAAQWRVNNYGTPYSKFPNLPLDLLTLATATVTNIMVLEIGDRFALGTLPSQTDATTYDLVAEGWTESGDADSWELVLNASNWEQERAWILANATYGVLGTTTKAGW